MYSFRKLESMKTAVIDYNMGNLGSVVKALAFLGADPCVVGKPADLEHFGRIILPGVGNFGDGMEQLRSLGFDRAFIKARQEGKFCFGICLGMQMMLEFSEEAPGVPGLGIFPGTCRKFDATQAKVPQIGWNTVRFNPECPLGKGLGDEPWFYFVHSYYVPLAPFTAGVASYTTEFSAAIGEKNCFAVQFHPEKSSDSGLALLRNFIFLQESGR